jgi:hypothetical protein
VRVYVVLPILSVLASCASDIPDVRDEMVGMSADRIETCLGAPAKKEATAKTQTWTYYTPETVPGAGLPSASLPLRGSTASDDGGRKACVVVVKMEQARVMAINYQNTSAAQTDSACATALERCAPPN